MRHVSRANPQHLGWRYVRKIEDSFALEGPSGEYPCLVLEPLREPLWLLCHRFVGGVIPSEILRTIVQMILAGLDYLHTECQVIHTGLWTANNASSAPSAQQS